MTLGIAVVATNLVAGIWGAAAWLRRSPSTVFWYLLRGAQAAVVAQVILGVVLLAGGKRPASDLHFVYGILPLVVTLVSEGMRVTAAQRELSDVGDPAALGEAEQVAVARRVVRREMGIMAVGAILIVTLALRAVATSGGHL
jgi:hypothetical protein